MIRFYCFFVFINLSGQILLVQSCSCFFLELLKLLLGLIFFVKLFFEPLFATFLCLNYFSTENIQRFISLKSNNIPFKRFNIICNFNFLTLPPILRNINLQLSIFHIEFLSHVKIKFFISFAAAIYKKFIFGEHVNKLHKLIERANFKNIFFDARS